MEEKKDNKPHVTIGVIGNTQGGRVKLIEEIEKILKEENNKKTKKISLKQESTSQHEIFIDGKDVENLDI